MSYLFKKSFPVLLLIIGLHYSGPAYSTSYRCPRASVFADILSWNRGNPITEAIVEDATVHSDGPIKRTVLKLSTVEIHSYRRAMFNGGKVLEITFISASKHAHWTSLWLEKQGQNRKGKLDHKKQLQFEAEVQQGSVNQSARFTIWNKQKLKDYVGKRVFVLSGGVHYVGPETLDYFQSCSRSFQAFEGFGSFIAAEKLAQPDVFRNYLRMASRRLLK
jgi:hypothetical protein